MSRLDRVAFERWLTGPEGVACIRRRGRPGRGERPLIEEAARRFGVDRRTVERALARIVRRQRLLAEHQPVDAATAGLLLDAAKSFVVGNNTTLLASQMRHSEQQPSMFMSGQSLRPDARSPGPPPPSPAQALHAVHILLAGGFLQVQDLQALAARHVDAPVAAVDVQLAAVGLHADAAKPVTTSPRPADPAQLSREALMDALDAYAATAVDIPPAVQAHMDGLRQAITRPDGA